jgi:DNA repair exonuclease SbcCD ATPase subunit
VVKGKQKDLIDFVSKNLITKELYQSCIFRAQGGIGDFLELSPSDRKDVFIRLLNLESLGLIAAKANMAAKAIDQQIVALQGKQQGLRSSLASPENSQEDLQAILDGLMVSTIPALESELLQLESQASELTNALAAESQKLQLHTTYVAKLKTLTSEERSSIDSLTALGTKKGQGEAILSKKELIVEAMENLTVAKKDLDEIEETIREAQELYTDEQAAWLQRKAEKQSLENTLERLNAELSGCHKAKADYDPPCKETELAPRCKLIAGSLELQAKIPDLEKQIAELKPQIEAIDLDKAFMLALGKNVESYQAVKEALKKDMIGLMTLAGQYTDLQLAQQSNQQIDSEIEAAKIQIAKLGEEKMELEAQIATFDSSNLDQIAIKQEQGKNAFALSRQKHMDAIAKVASLKTEIETSSKTMAALSDVCRAIDAMEIDRSDCQQLAYAFGKEGIQLMEIDAAGPAVSDLINEYLHSCFGHRFTVKLITTAAKKTGDAGDEKNVFDLIVFDNEQGREAKVQSLSGGEKVYIGLATQLAIVSYLNHKSGLKPKLIVLDECLGALTEDNAQIAVQMLRHARQMIGLKHLLFVAHLDSLGALCDGIVTINDGKIEVTAA